MHELGYSIGMEGDELVVRDRRGVRIPPVRAREPLADGALDRIRRHVRESGISISVDTNATAWDGERPDYDACVAALAP